MWACTLDGALDHHFRACALVGALDPPPPFNVKVILGGHVRVILGGHVRVILGGHMKAILGGHIKAILGGHVRVILGGHMKAILGGHVRIILGGHVRVTSVLDTWPPFRACALIGALDPHLSWTCGDTWPPVCWTPTCDVKIMTSHSNGDITWLLGTRIITSRGC